MIRFSKVIWLYFVISALVLLPGMYSLVRFGLKPSVDFSGGTLLEFRAGTPIEPDAIRAAGEALAIDIVSVQRSGTSDYLLRMKPETETHITALATQVATKTGTTIAVVRQETVGPVLGKELLNKAVVAAILAITAILLYVAWAFKNIKYGVAAIIALVHDLLVVLGTFAILGQVKGVEVDTLFVTAFLTTMSFSVHDTIVVFDRIREYLKRDRSRPFADLCDIALTETMNRSVTNSFTIIFMLMALALMGGESIRWFVIALLVGTVSGTYSSPFIATPTLLLWDKWEHKKKTPKAI